MAQCSRRILGFMEMIVKYFLYVKRVFVDFIKYYLVAAVGLGFTGELFNIALRVWSSNKISFYSNDLWQTTLIMALFFTVHVMLEKHTS